MGWIRLLSGEIGPRRPTGAAERRAAAAMAGELAREGVEAVVEPFRGYPSFLWPYGVVLGLAVAPALVPRRLRVARAAMAGGALAAMATEGGLVRTPLSDALSVRGSQNVVAEIPARQEARRTVCLSCHLDSSRSGLMFHPDLVGWLGGWISVQSAAVAVQAAEPLLRGRRGRRLVAAARAVAGLGLALMVERELRGRDVAGANDNASGAAVAARLAVEVAVAPLRTTRLVLLMTGCEESGLLGAQAFLRSRDTADWLFVNFDGVGGPATLRYLLKEGVLRKWDSDPALVELCASVAGRRPELGLHAAERTAGLTYDVTPVMARGGRAITLSVQDRVIPNYHWETDTADRIDVDGVGRALEVGRELLRALDRGEADRAAAHPPGCGVRPGG